MDFYRDMLQEARRWLDAWGIHRIHTGTDPNKAKLTPLLTPVAELEDQALGVAFFRTLHRLPRAYPRKFVRSSVRLPKLSKAERAGLKKLREEVERGDLLWHRLSRRWVQGQTDGLLNDWNIFHFHLHNDLDEKADGFVVRSKHVALAIVTQTRFLLIAVRPHGSGIPAPWYDKDYLRVIADHWPEELKVLPGVVGLEPEVDDPKTIRDLRAVGVTVMHQIGDQVVMPPGMGVSLDGGSSAAVMEHNRYGHKFRHWQTAWVKQLPGLEAKLRYFPETGFVLESQGQLWLADEGADPAHPVYKFFPLPALYTVYLQRHYSRFPQLQLWSLRMAQELAFSMKLSSDLLCFVPALHGRPASGLLRPVALPPE